MRTPFLLTMSLLSLSACSFTPEEPIPFSQTYLSEPLQNKVEIVMREYTLSLPPVGYVLDAEQRADLRSWMGDTSGAAVEYIEVALPLMSPLQHDATMAMLRKEIRRLGIPASKMRVSEDSTAAGTVTLRMDHAVAVTPRCPNWSGNPQSDKSNGWHSNFSCATTTNLGRMVADPRDLEYGSRNWSYDGQMNAAAVGTYRGTSSGGSSSGSSSSSSSGSSSEGSSSSSSAQ